MLPQAEKRPAPPIEPQGGLESPFLGEELFTYEVQPEWESRLAALETESSFLQAFREYTERVIEPGGHEEEVDEEGMVFPAEVILEPTGNETSQEEALPEGLYPEGDELELMEGRSEEESEEEAGHDNTFFRVANDITGAFEGGKPGTLNLYDKGIISYGKHQATLASGTLYHILKRFSELSGSETAKQLATYLPRVKSRHESLRGEKPFIRLLQEAAHEPEMSRAQDEIFAEKYWKPAKMAAAETNVRSAIGHAIYYDTRIQGGLSDVIKRTMKHLGGKVGDVVHGQPISEQEYLRVFVEERNKRTLQISAKQATEASKLLEEANSLEAQAISAEYSKGKKLRRLAAVKRQKAARSAANSKALERSAGKTRGPTFVALVNSGDLELRGDAKGWLHLAGKPGVKIRGLGESASIDEVAIGTEQEVPDEEGVNGLVEESQEWGEKFEDEEEGVADESSTEGENEQDDIREMFDETEEGEALLFEPDAIDDERFSVEASIEQHQDLDLEAEATDTQVHTVLSGKASIRTGPPDFRSSGQWIPRSAKVRVLETQEPYARVVGVDGREYGWTDLGNLGTFYKDSPRLLTTPLAPATPVAIPKGWPARRRRLAETYNRLGGLMGVLSSETGIPLTAILAVWYIESGGRRHVPGHALIRFENHLFYKRWGKANQSTYDAHFQHGIYVLVKGNKKKADWKGHQFRERTDEPFGEFHGNQEREYRVLAFASRLAGEEAALQCISIGGPQILVSNYRLLGYPTPRAMYEAFQAGESAQVLGFFDFCQYKFGYGRRRGEMIGHLAALRWEKFALGYNGSGQVKLYAAKLRGAYQDAQEF